MNYTLSLLKFSLAVLFLALVNKPTIAQIIPDETLGSEASRLNQNILINNEKADLIDGGAQRGSNLFHSFTQFNINDGQRVLFSNPSEVINILTRVTGKNASNILGTLGVNGAANLFLINPNGILFGENASLDVRGSFVATTANGVQFGKQSVFSATNPELPPLLTVNPSALLFNQMNQNVAIQNNSIAPAKSSADSKTLGLQVPDGKSLLLVGGNVYMDGGQLSAYGGRVELGGLAEPGNINLTLDGNNFSLEFPQNSVRASVLLTNKAGVSVIGSGGGDITVNAQNLNISGGSSLFAGIDKGLGTAETIAGDIILNATGEIRVVGSDSGVFNLLRQGAKGNGGDIIINSGSFSLQDSGRLSASTFGEGNAGNVTVRASDFVSLAGEKTAIFSTVEPEGIGRGGDININAASLSLANGAQMQALIRRGSDTQQAGQGDAGNVNIQVSGEVDIVGQENGFSSGIFSLLGTSGQGDGGDIIIDTGSLSLRDNAQLSASTFGRGNAGNIKVRAKDTVFLGGRQTNILSRVGADGIGRGGNIDINATSILIKDGAQIAASTSGQGSVGNVTLQAKDAVSLSGEQTSIFSTVEPGGLGRGGNIDINAGSLSLQDGAQLGTAFAEAFTDKPTAQGDAGDVNIKVTGVVDIAGEKNGFPSGIFSRLARGSKGNGGDINIDSASFSLRDGAQLVASTFGEGNAGNIRMHVKDNANFAGIQTSVFTTVEAGGVGKGGNIDINADSLSIVDGAQLQTSTRQASANQPSGRGDAGDVNIKVTDTIDIAGSKGNFASGIRSLMETGTIGNGGNITIDSGSFLLRDSARLTTSTSGQGNAGNVTVRASGFVSLTGEQTSIFSTVEPGGVGKGGNIDINGNSLSLSEGAQLVTATFEASANQPSGRGDAGNVNIKVTDTVDIAGEKNGFASGIFSSIRTGVEGNGGNITIDSDSFSLRNGSQLVTSTSGQGNAGSILVNASDAITISGTSKESGLSSALFSSNNPNSTGKSGNITANTNLFHIADGALLDARTQNNFMGGDITINTNIFEALNGGQISATALGSGRAGKITVNATKKAIISGSDLSYNHRVTKFPNLVVNLGANSGLFVTSSGSAITGDIEVNSPKIRLDNQAILNAESTSGNGGNINLNSDLLVLRRDSQISTNAGTEKKGGDGGNININSKFIVAVPKENSDITANAFSGTGGKVNINTLSIYGIEVRPQPSDTTNDVTASSELGVQGQISVNNLDIELSKGIIELPEDVLDATNKVAQICSKDSYSKKPLGEFIITGRDNLPPSPLDMTVGNSNIRPLATLDKEEREQKYETQSKQEEQEAKTFIFSVSDDSKATFKEYRTDITEAQDWVKTADGTITLVAQTPNTTPSVSNTNIKCLK